MLPGPFRSPKFTWRLEHIVRYCVVWCCVALRCDPPGRSSFARYRSFSTDLSAPRISRCTKEPNTWLQITLRGAARSLRCVARCDVALRASTLLMLHEVFRSPKLMRHLEHITRYRMVWRGVALRCDPPGRSTFARSRSSRTGRYAPRILLRYLEHIARHRAASRGVALRGAARRSVARARSLSNEASAPPNLARQIAKNEL